MVKKKETHIERSVTKKNKIYVLDTNVLIHDPKALFAFEGAHVGIPSVVLEELDGLKKEGTDRGRSAREAIRILDNLRQKGSLGTGVTLENGTMIQVLFAPEKPDFPFLLDWEDNQILCIAAMLKQKGYEVVFISKDLNARVKADALQINAEDYMKEQVTQEDFYHGWQIFEVPAVQLKSDIPESLHRMENKDFAINEFVALVSNNNPNNYRVFRYLGNKRFKSVHSLSINWPFREKNMQQLMALDLLFDDQVQLVTLLGPAGTGKTFLALLAGLYKVQVEHVYQKMLISRPIIPLGRDLGYLPGELKDKLHNWMLPIYDNMDFIVHTVARNHLSGQYDVGTPDLQKSKNHGKDGSRNDKQHNRDQQKKPRGGGVMQLDDLISHGKVALEAITYMRGRSIPYQFILIDEAQNLTPHEIKALITRAGEGSKIILCGDPYQIDSPYLDFASNGLVVASERFKNNALFGSVFLQTSERSQLSQMAADLL